jgi:uncharacterized protein (DUF433 family)
MSPSVTLSAIIMGTSDHSINAQEVIELLKKGLSYNDIQNRFPMLTETDIKAMHREGLHQENQNHLVKPVYCKLSIKR